MTPESAQTASPRPAEPRVAKKKINLALQGGGAHGAFAWGVIDRLLEDERLEFEGIVGTSAGAMNAAVTAYGLSIGRGPAAREALGAFWKKISDAARLSPLQPSIWDRLLRPGNLDLSPGFLFYDAVSRVFSPYQLNPTNYNPLRSVLASVVDCDAIHNARRVKLFVCASNVITGKIKVFDKHDVSIDAIMASACLPFMFQAVEIDGEHYWDGGYMGNPPLYPLIYQCDSSDVVIIQINPIKIPELPRSAQAILDRINTLSFNSSLMREMRAINFVTHLIDNGFTDGGRLKRMHIHTIDAEATLAQLGVSSKLNADWSFLTGLYELGREKASEFLARHFDDIGVRSSTDIAQKFL